MSGFERGETDEFARGARALVIYPELPGRASVGPEARLAEAEGLALAIGLNVVRKKHYRVRSPRAVTLLGGGQVEEIAEMGRELEADLLIVDASLTAIQQRNLEERTGLKTIDRAGLILEIFGERAATAEGRLQVELAHLDYQAGRLVRSWTHLERQRGGFGFLGGPGETQIEADRRMIRDRMARLRRELEEVKRTRSLHRARRKRAPWPVIALVGYTNAGKSTLFNRLTRATVLAEDMLFATLDPTMRQITLPGVEKAILSDTVISGNRASDWKIIEVGRRLAPIPVISWPPIITRPAVGALKPAISRRRVVLPHPEGPRRQTRSPFSTARLTSFTTARSP